VCVGVCVCVCGGVYTEVAAEVVEGTDDPETEVFICQVLSHGLAKRLDRTPPCDVRTGWIYNMARPSW